jgi:hypothetical protein
MLDEVRGGGGVETNRQKIHCCGGGCNAQSPSAGGVAWHAFARKLHWTHGPAQHEHTSAMPTTPQGVQANCS